MVIMEIIINMIVTIIIMTTVIRMIIAADCHPDGNSRELNCQQCQASLASLEPFPLTSPFTIITIEAHRTSLLPKLLQISCGHCSWTSS